MEQIDKDFALEMISLYGEDRFYNCCKRTGGGLATLKLHMELNGTTRDKSRERLLSIRIDPYARPVAGPAETSRETVCRIACGFVRFYKELGRRSHELPAKLKARMLLGETNEWVREYASLLQTFPDWPSQNK